MPSLHNKYARVKYHWLINILDSKVFFMNLQKSLEWFGVITAIVYSLLVAFNIGAEFLGFTLLLISAIAI